MLEYVTVALLAFLCPTDAASFYITPNNTVECVNDLVKWCDGMKYPQEGVGMAMVSVSITDRNGYHRILCAADNDGTNCTKNGEAWFSCSKDNKFFYKGNQLREGSVEGTDDDTCKTATMAFDDLLVQNLSYNNETLSKALEKGMEKFFEEMATMREKIEDLNSKIMSIFGNSNKFWFDNYQPEISYEYDIINEGNQQERE